MKYDLPAATDRLIIEVAAIAEQRSVHRVRIALAWLLYKKPVTTPIIGAEKISHLEDALLLSPLN
ncbi:Aldo/keto reductase family protein [compost metagenome]